MSKGVACQIVCQCGGRVETLNDGTYYVLTDKHTIIFLGLCNRCHEGVRVEKPILELMVHCPIDNARAN